MVAVVAVVVADRLVFDFDEESSSTSLPLPELELSEDLTLLLSPRENSLNFCCEECVETGVVIMLAKYLLLVVSLIWVV